MVEVAVRRVKEELLVPELMAKLDRPSGLATVGLFPEGKLLWEAHFDFFEQWIGLFWWWLISWLKSSGASKG